MYISDFDNPLTEGIRDPGIFKAIFMAGPPGAGKNTVINKLGLAAYGLKLQDVDHTMAMLIRRGYPINYEKSLGTTLRRQSLLQQQMLGLLINTTGRDAENLMDLNKNLKKSGYDTFMLFVDVEKEVALRRIQQRPYTSTDPRDAGRPVDLDYFERAFEDSKRNIDFYALIFGDRFALVTNNEELTESSPKEVLDVTMKIAARKIERFMREPLNPIAQTIVNGLITS